MSNLIEIKNLSKVYGRNKKALNDVSLSIPEGKIIGLLGPNGSGKTTLLKIINGLLKDYTGEILIDKHSIGPYSKSIISFLSDEPYFFDWMKVKDALKMFEDIYTDFCREKALKIMERYSIEESMDIKTMSKGTKEKFQLALVMARNAKLLILDEPIGGVDPAAREVILDTILSNYSEEQTIIIATHLIADIEKIFDSVIFIKDGEIVLQEEVENIRMQNKSVDELFREVFKC